MPDEPRKPDGSQKANESAAGRVTQLERSLVRAASQTRMPDLDLRNEQMVGPRKPAGPPLQEPEPRKSVRASSRAAAEPTDPAPTRTAERGAAPKRKRPRKARRSKPSTKSRRRSMKKSKRPGRRR
jgi:hypothetical protein